MYHPSVPNLWTETVETHRNEVRQAIMDTTAALVGEQGLRAVTMSEIAEKTGIGRATLYKYFPDVESILYAWHEAHLDCRLDHLAHAGDAAENPRERLESVLEAHALHIYETRRHHQTDVAALVHTGEHVAQAQQRLHDFIEELITHAVEARVIRDDVSPAELTQYCLHAIGAAQDLSSKAAVGRLVAVTLDAMQA